jgi:hypothetical protein
MIRMLRGPATKTGVTTMRARIKFVLVAATSVLLALASCSDKQTTGGGDLVAIEDLLVRNNEITGWTYQGSGWTASSISELTVYINGLAEVFERHGFVEASFRAYQGTIDDGTRTLELTVYNQGTTANAQDTFDDPDTGMSGATTWTDGPGDAAHYVRFGGLSQALAFYHGPYFVQLRLNYDTEESLNILKQFALNVDGKID